MPLVDPTKFWHGVGDAHIRLWRRDDCILDANIMFLIWICMA